MTTVINGGGDGSSSAVGIIVGIVVALVIVALFFVYALPALTGKQQGEQKPEIKIELPSPTGNGGSQPQ